jgi:exosortase/archaeosortase family protein
LVFSATNLTSRQQRRSDPRRDSRPATLVVRREAVVVNPGLALRTPRTLSISTQVQRVASAARRSPELAGAAALVIVGLVAYRFTLVSLGADLRLDTPLAYLPLLPLFSVYLAIDAVRRYRGQPRPPREGVIDTLVGVPLLVVSLLLITALPVISSTYYWSDRPDVLSLSLFMVGSVSLLFGLGWVWRLRWALVFLLLMWPGLYLHALTGVLSGFSTATNDALNLLVVHLPFGVRSGGSTGLLLVPQHGSVTPLAVSVSSACAGSDTGLGFALVGGAVLTTRRGPIWRRMTWLALGIVGAFALNVGRISSILLIARYGSAHFALDGYHAVVGLILFTGLIMVMVWLLPRFGLTPAAAGAELASRPAADVQLIRGQVPATSARVDPLAALHRAIDQLTAPMTPPPPVEVAPR